MSAAEVAADVLRRCTEQRAWLAACEAADPRSARSRRRFWAERNTVPIYDDPPITVRASQLEALCAAVLGEPAPTPHPDQMELFT